MHCALCIMNYALILQQVIDEGIEFLREILHKGGAEDGGLAVIYDVEFGDVLAVLILEDVVVGLGDAERGAVLLYDGCKELVHLIVEGVGLHRGVYPLLYYDAGYLTAVVVECHHVARVLRDTDVDVGYGLRFILAVGEFLSYLADEAYELLTSFHDSVCISCLSRMGMGR